jgi:hypothetical protein
VSLRSRLTTAFLVVVLGPVLVGAVFVAAVMSHLAESRSQERLDAAVAAVDATLGTICERISASAAAVALNYGTSGTAGAVDMAELVIDRRVVDGVMLDGVDDGVVRLGAWPHAGQWIGCGEDDVLAASGTDADAVALIGARAEVAESGGAIAEFTAYRLVDQYLIDRLAATVEAQIVLPDGRSSTVGGGVDADKWRFTDTYIPLRVGVNGTDIAAMYWMLFAAKTWKVGRAFGHMTPGETFSHFYGSRVVGYVVGGLLIHRTKASGLRMAAAMEHLIDGDFASNNGGWGFSASVGVDPQPYFRVFNPTLQSEKFDPQGEYIRKWVPELAKVEGKAIHEPYARGSGNIAKKAGYPEPMVEHKQVRERALAAYKNGLDSQM